jgi:membrane-associated phospholipid phosphatase
MRSGRHPVLILVCALLLVALSIAFLDRPWATWAHAHLRGAAVFVKLTLIAEVVPPLAAAIMGLAAVAALFGWRPGPRAKVVLGCCLAAVAAIAVKEQLKYVCGRTWPETWVNNNPSWIANGVFEFVPFHGGKGWSSFPSGHTAEIAAPMAALWCALGTARRWLCAVPVALVAVGLLGADYHWISDIVAGAYIGFASGVGTWALVGYNRWS